MDCTKLNDFSKQIYHQLYAYKPQLISQAEGNSDSDGNFYLKIRSPIKEESIWLVISTDADPNEEEHVVTGEVTWEYDYFHSHSFGQNARGAFEWLKEDINALFERRKFIGSGIDKGKWLGSRELNQAELDEFLTGILGTSNNAAYINRVVGWNNIYIK